MATRIGTADLSKLRGDLEAAGASLDLAFVDDLEAIGRDVRDSARADFEARFEQHSGRGLASIRSAATRRRASIFVDGAVATDDKGRPYPVFLHQGFEHKGGRDKSGRITHVAGRAFLDLALERRSSEIERRIDLAVGRVVARHITKGPIQ